MAAFYSRDESMKHIMITAACAVAALASAPALAHEPGAVRADAHAPIGVMGDHTHAAHEWMLSYRVMHMAMSGNHIGTDSLSPEAIVTTIANPHAGPATLRVVPVDMKMDMHMLSVMYGLTDRITLMAMAQYREAEMEHITFAGMMGQTRLGRFSARSEGLGDTSIVALAKVFESESDTVLMSFGLSLPTGSIDETGSALTPANMVMSAILPYGMQLGSGTYDPLVSATWRHRAGHWQFGTQASGRLHAGENDAGYARGNEARATVWTSWSPRPAWSFSTRLSGQAIGEISGEDARITAPVQTADPANYGGKRLDFGLGVNWMGQSGVLAGHRLALEASMPVWQDLNGPQLGSDWLLTLGWQYAWAAH